MSSEIVLKPRMSEKTYAHSASGIYVFDVPLTINKYQVAKAIEETFNVTVLSVRTVIVKGKKKRLYRKRRFEKGVRNNVKKAYVQLKEGDSIPVFASVEDTSQKDKKTTNKIKKEDK